MKLPAVMTEAFLKCLPDDERKKLGRRGWTREECEAVYIAGQEREFKKIALQELNRRGAWVFEQPMNRRTRGRLGTPDLLVCYKGFFAGIELKCTGQSLREEQAGEMTRIRAAGGRVIVAYNLRDIQALLNAIELL